MLCWGASLLAVLPIPWAQLVTLLRLTTVFSPPNVAASYVVTEPPHSPLRFSSATAPVFFNRLEVSWAEIWRNHHWQAAHADSPAEILARNQQALAQQPELIVDLSDRQLYLYQGKKLEEAYPIAIGQVGWETPKGIFQVMEMKRDPAWIHPITGRVVPAGEDNPLGEAWIGFWYNQGYHIGFHGTAQNAEMGQAISHGCVRLRNADILELYDRVEVGWVVTVRD
jgi:L,D-transpeptidase ErfK/SrfK